MAKTMHKTETFVINLSQDPASQTIKIVKVGEDDRRALRVGGAVRAFGKQDKADFVNVNFWGCTDKVKEKKGITHDNIDVVTEYATKGSLLMIKGYRTEGNERPDGGKYNDEISVLNVQLLESSAITEERKAKLNSKDVATESDVDSEF